MGSKSASSDRAEDKNVNGQIIVRDMLAKDAEDRVHEVPGKAEKSYVESNAASLATEEPEISSMDAEQDEPVEESENEILTGLPIMDVRSASSDAMTNDVDHKSHSDSGLEANDIRRNESLDEEVWQQKSSDKFVLENISNN